MEVRIVQAGGLAATYALASDWGAGFQGAFQVSNGQSTTAANWRLEFDLGASLSSVWNGTVLSHVGSHYVVGGASWNTSLPAGGTADVGFTATGKSATPTNIQVNGSAVAPTVSVTGASVNEGSSGTTLLPFVVSLSRASTSPITVHYATTDATATAGTDYRAASGTVTFAPGVTSQVVNVEVLGDTTVEPDETMVLTLTAPSGATISGGSATGTIVNDDQGPLPTGSVTVAYKTISDWGSGLNGQFTLTNATTQAQTAWTLAFDFAGPINSIWDGVMASHVGNRYTVKAAAYDGTIPAGGSVSFGFGATKGGLTPTNVVFSATGSGGTANKAPVAVNDAATTNQGTPINIKVLANDTDPDGDPLSIASVAAPGHGRAVANVDGTVGYTPVSGYVGSDSFTYVLSDGKGGTATGTVAVSVVAPVTATTWPSHVYAPYVDMGLYPTYNLATASQTSGVKFFTLAFITADPSGNPSWGGYASYGVNGSDFDLGVRSQIQAVRALGGDVMVSFGGASGQELAEKITSVPALTAAYQKVVDAYGLTRIDFDIEGAAVADHASIDRRSQAVAALQANAAAAGRPLQVDFTLPVLPTGLTNDGLYVVQSAVRAGVQVGNVNVMAMDYGDSAAPNPSGHMGDYAIQAASSLFNQLRTVYGSSKTDAQLWGMVGITPMIGLNDVTTEVFDQQEARELTAFAQQHGIGRISIWSLNRDRQSPSGKISYVDLTSSSLVQSNYEFSTIFKGFQS